VTDAHTPVELPDEARALYRAVFRSDPTLQIVQRYVDAHRAGFGACTETEAAWLQRAFSSGADLVALEFVLRRRNRRHALVRKFHIVTYIAEGSPGHAVSFLNQQPVVARAFSELFVALVRSIWLAIKGHYLLRRQP
jgi:hypothetical protein